MKVFLMRKEGSDAHERNKTAIRRVSPARLWDKETQINYFLEYAEEYQLSAHFCLIWR